MEFLKLKSLMVGGLRIYFAEEKNTIILLLIGGDKKTQVKDIKKLKNIGGNMANRNKDYNKILAKKFENIEYARKYLINIVKREKLPIEEALCETIKAMGLKKFSDKSGISIQAVSDFVNKRQKWSLDKISRHIGDVFHLKLKISLELAKAG